MEARRTHTNNRKKINNFLRFYSNKKELLLCRVAIDKMFPLPGNGQKIVVDDEYNKACRMQLQIKDFKIKRTTEKLYIFNLTYKDNIHFTQYIE